MTDRSGTSTSIVPSAPTVYPISALAASSTFTRLIRKASSLHSSMTAIRAPDRTRRPAQEASTGHGVCP